MVEKFTVIGIVHSEGSYEGQQYNNYNFHCIKPADTSKGQVGSLCEIIKVKSSILDKLPQVDDIIIPVYDRYGRVQSIIVE